MDLTDALFEEYRTVRQEALDGVSRLQSVVQYVFAGITVGIAAALALVSASHPDVSAGVALLMSLPVIAIFGVLMMGIEVQRVVGARRHLRGLERRINREFGESTSPLSWEATRKRDPGFRVVEPYRLTFFMMMLVAVAGPAIGAIILVDHHLWAGLVLAVGADVALIVIAGRYSDTAYKSLQALDDADQSVME